MRSTEVKPRSGEVKLRSGEVKLRWIKVTVILLLFTLFHQPCLTIDMKGLEMALHGTKQQQQQQQQHGAIMVLLLAPANWVTQAAIKNEVLVVCSTLGQVYKVTLLQHLRLAAKVILLQSNVRSAEDGVKQRSLAKVKGSSEVKSGSSEVNNESSEVNKGSSEVKSGSSEVNNESSEVKSGSSEVNNESSEVKSGSSEVNKGSSEVKSRSSEVNNGASEVNNRSSEVNNESSEVNNRSSEVKNELRCVLWVLQAHLLHTGNYTFKNFFEAIRVGPKGSHLVGYLGGVVNALANSLHFTYDIMEGKSFGVKTYNGSYDGVIGHVQRKEGDLGLASLSMTHSRSQAIDFTSWLRFQPTLFVTRGPRYLKDATGVFKLYTWQVWCILPLALLLSGVFVWLLWPSPHPNYWPQQTTTHPTTPHQGWSKRPPLPSVLASVLKAAVYQAFLFTPIRTYPPSTIHQLVVKDWSIVLDKAYGHHDLIKDTKTHNYQTLYRRALERGGLRENEGATTDTKITPSDFLNRDIAVVMGEPGVFHTLNTIKGPDGRCLLTYSHQAIAEEFAGLAVPKRSLLKPIIDNK
ncbi:hypothetical protein Pmani_012410 [Petrolisthes manimaculis]|uniref:Ionotropic glutamate receptor L-glutamate and glycine-binding domain-containing protein n=1 Tax=Petrolisthes manimaculis TaxID=1843537 RepID=A0AAE1PXX5_9EUCA|nr:hypothetical protein Pmani_012410 [Petrolisthes manimaculis]